MYSVAFTTKISTQFLPFLCEIYVPMFYVVKKMFDVAGETNKKASSGMKRLIFLYKNDLTLLYPVDLPPRCI